MRIAKPKAVHPNRVEYQGRRVRVGPSVYSLIKLVLSRGGSATWGRIARDVFGEPIQDRTKVDVLVHRANQKLGAIECPLRLGVDAQRVTLT